MYCCKCGKEIPNGTICYECAAQAQPTNYPPVRQAPDYSYVNGQPNWMPEPNNRMYGFGKALASTIIATIGFIFSYIGFLLLIWDNGTAAGFVLFSIPLVIIPFILGISSIKLFSARKNFCAKPVATLILGIVSVATAGLSAFFSFFGFLVLLAMQ